MRVCACLPLVALVAATEPARVHEARQGPISTVTQLPAAGPGPVSLQTSSSTSTASKITTMSATSSISPSSSTAGPQPSEPSSPGSLNITVHNMTTCTSGLISWNYGGKEAELLLLITNNGVDQSHALSRLKTRQGPVSNTTQQQLVTTNTSALSWTWSSVNLTQGWYEIQGLAFATPTVNNTSAPFFIANGTSVACLAGTSPQASSTVSPSANASPSSAASKTNVAGIVGGVVGAVAGVTLAIIAGVWLWSRRRKVSLVGGGGSRNRKWGSLKSTTSSLPPEGGGTQLTGHHFHSHSESTGGILQDVADGKASATTTPAGSDENAGNIGEEKLVSPASSSGMSPFDVLNTPIHHDRRASAYYFYPNPDHRRQRRPPTPCRLSTYIQSKHRATSAADPILDGIFHPTS
ncbi:hypothetical protein J3R83DRAFT_10271 [Lanmaoa asiatica]|nr:hypothetical protein J3R83DRAFT_10271 [Lanmaoa asiatica]